MNIIEKPLGEMKDISAVKRLYQTAFPKHEQIPWYLLRLLAACGRLRVDGYEDGGTFCGLTVSARTDKVLFVLFFAVEDAVRGKGYGSRILERLQQSDPTAAVVLNVEPLDAQAENAAQRVQRMRFYNRNGFFETGYEIDEVGGTFRVLSNQPLDAAAYLQVFRKISLGFWRPAIRRLSHDQTADA